MSAAAKSKVSIAILEARGLTAKDRNGLSDPFCEVRLVINGKKEDPKYETRVVPKTLAPVWKERFVFINESLASPTASIVVKCFDFNRIAAPRFEGIVQLSLHELLDGLPENGVYEKWLPLQAYKADIDVSGDLHVQLAWGELPLDRLEQPTVLSPEEQARIDHNKQLELQQLRKLRGDADGIKPVTETLKNLTNYAVVNDATQKLKDLGTTVGDVVVPKKLRRKKDDAAAADDGAKADADADADAKAADSKNEDADNAEAVALAAAAGGGARRPLYYFVSQVLTEPLGATPLADADATKLQSEVEEALNVGQLGKLASALQRPRSTPSLLRNLLYRLYTLENHPAYAKAEWQHKKQYFAHIERQRDTLRECIRSLVHPAGFSGKLSIEVLEAQDLPACDSNGLSDPYCMMQLGSESAKTKTQMRTLAPKWKNELHTLNVTNLKATLEISLWDWDTTSEDDFMGNVLIPLADLLDGAAVNKWYKLSTDKGSVHLSLQLKYPYVEYWRAIDADAELRNCGLAGLADGQLGALPSAVDLLLDCTSHITELYEQLLLMPPARVSVSTDPDVHRRTQWLVEAYGDRFGVPLARRRLELVRLLVRVGNNNKLSARDVDPFALPTPPADASTAAPHIWSQSDALLNAFLTVAADPAAVTAPPDVLLLDTVFYAVCDVRQLVAHSLLELSGHELAWDKSLLARMPPRRRESELTVSGKEAVAVAPSALTRAEVALFRALVLALAHQRFAVMRRFKTHYSVDSPKASLSTNINVLRELVDKDELHPLLREAVLGAAAFYHQEVAPSELTGNVDGITAVHTVIQQELDEDDVYARAFPKGFTYVDAVTSHYIVEYVKAFTHFCETCPYDSSAFVAWESGCALWKTLLARLSPEARQRVPEFDMAKLFSPFVFGWLKETSIRLENWTANAIKIDTHEAAHDEVQYSAGIVDAFAGCQQAYQYLQKLGLDSSFVNCQFAEVACNVMRRYVDLESLAFCDMVDQIDSNGKLVVSEDAKKELQAAREKRGEYNNSKAIKPEAAAVAAAKQRSSSGDSTDRLRKLLHIGGGNSNSNSSSGLSSSNAKRDAPTTPFKVSSELCVAMSNIEEARFKLDELLSSFGDAVEEITKRAAAAGATDDKKKTKTEAAAEPAKTEASARDLQMQAILTESFEALSRDTFVYLSNRRDELLALLTQRLHRWPASHIAQIKAGDTPTIKELSEYYDEQWSVLATALRHKTFGQYQQQTWIALMEGLQDRLLADTRCITDQYLEELIEYFHGDGEGLGKTWLEEHSVVVRRLIKYNAMTTYQLVKVYYSCKRAITAPDVPADASAPAVTEAHASAVAEAAAADAPLALPVGATPEQRIEALQTNMRDALTLIHVRAKLDGKEGTANAEDKEARAFIKEWEALERNAKKAAGGKHSALAASGSGSSSGVAAAVAPAGGAPSALASSKPAEPTVPLTKEQKLRAKFMLPPSESIIEDFVCRAPTLPGTIGKLYVTTSHVCYGVRWGDDDDESTANTLVFEMDNIVSMHIKGGLLSSSLFITSFNAANIATEHTFDRFPMAKKCAALIVSRAKLLEHEIEMVD